MSMRRWAGIGVAGIALAVLSGVMTAGAMRPKSQSDAKAEANLPALYIADDKQDLGNVWESCDAILTVPISNRTDKPIEILDFESSCDCGEISPRQLTVPANGTANVTVKMDLTRRTPQHMGMVRRKFGLTMVPVLNGTVQSLPLTICGIARSVITLNHTSMHFGDTNVSGRDLVSRKLVVTLHEAVQDLAIASDDDSVRVKVAKRTSDTYELEISPNTTKSPASFSSKIKIAAIERNGKISNRLSVSVEGTLVSQ